MNEAIGRLDSLIRNAILTVREKLPVVTPEQRLERDARKVALESVQLFIDSDVQAPKATFKARSKNVIDLDKEKAGSILRVTLSSNWDRANYHEPRAHRWYVIGRDPNQKTYVWEIGQESTGKIPQQGGELRIPQDDIELTPLLRIKKHVFNPRTISYNFHRIPRELEIPLKVDRMWSGVIESNPQPAKNRVEDALKHLTPIPELAKTRL